MFEGFKAKVSEALETGKAKGQMTSEQGKLSHLREEDMRRLDETGVEVSGEVEISDLGKYESNLQNAFRKRLSIKGIFDGKKVEMEYDTFLTGRRQAHYIQTNFHCVVDGVEITSEEEIRALWEKIRVAAPVAKRLQNMQSLKEYYKQT